MELVPIPSVLSAPYAGVQLSEEAARAPGRGLQSAGRSIMQVGQQIEDVSQKMQAAKDHTNLIKAKLIQDEGKAEFDQWQALNPDESLWENKARETVAKVNEKIGALKLSRQAQEQFLEHKMTFDQKFPTLVRQAATQKAVQSMKQTSVTYSEDLAKKGDLAGADRAIDEGARVGLFDENEALLRKKANGRVATISYIQKLTREDGQEAVRQLAEQDKDGNYVNFASQLSQQDRITLLHSADQAVARGHEQTAQAYSKEIYEAQANNDPVAQMAMERRIDADVELGKLLPTQANNLKRTMARSWDPEEVKARTAVLMLAARKLPTGDAAAFDEGAMRINVDASTLPEAARRSIDEAIDRARKGPADAAKTPTTNAHKWLEDFLKTDGFGPYADLDQPEYEVETEIRGGGFPLLERVKRAVNPLYQMKRTPETKQYVLNEKGQPIYRIDERGNRIVDEELMAKNRAARQTAFARYTDAEDALTAFLKANPGAKEADALAFVKQYTLKDRQLSAFGPRTIDPTAAP